MSQGPGLSAPLRVLVVDDEPLARMRLVALLRQLSAEAGGAAPGEAAAAWPRAEVVGEAGDAEAALARLADTPCDLVLLDIALPGRDGLRTASALRALRQAPQVVFVTAHAEHALAAFDLDATDYLTKPVRRDRLQAALARVARRLGREAVPAAPASAGDAAPPPPGLAATGAGAASGDVPTVLSFSHRGRVQRVPLDEILSLKAEQKYVRLSTRTQGQWLLDESLSELDPRLGAGFLRVHRNAIVALAAVRALERGSDLAASVGDGEGGLESWVVRLSDGQVLAVSRRQVAAVREALR